MSDRLDYVGSVTRIQGRALGAVGGLLTIDAAACISSVNMAAFESEQGRTKSVYVSRPLGTVELTDETCLTENYHHGGV
jgi:hypothetical protein